MAQVTRLGLYGGARVPYVGFVATVTAAITGTIFGATEVDIRAGGKTIIVTLSNATWATGLQEPSAENLFIQGLDSDQSETFGWNNEVRDKQALGNLTRDSNVKATLVLDAQLGYNISELETIEFVASLFITSESEDITATPTFDITPLTTAKLRHRGLIKNVGRLMR